MRSDEIPDLPRSDSKGGRMGAMHRAGSGSLGKALQVGSVGLALNTHRKCIGTEIFLKRNHVLICKTSVRAGLEFTGSALDLFRPARHLDVDKILTFRTIQRNLHRFATAEDFKFSR
eukprot:s840_g2.t1